MNLKEITNKLYIDSKETPKRALSNIANAEALFKEAYEGRYFFELIQNVRDANKEINQDGEVYIELMNKVLSISNTGPEFSNEGIESITNIGQSTKQSQDFIGFKGIGFKSVQEITMTPRIVTLYGSVYFDRKLTFEKLKEKNLVLNQTPLFFCPHFNNRKLLKSEIDKEIVTKIELPLKEKVYEQNIIDTFSEIQKEQLVLLGNLKGLYFESEYLKKNFLIKKGKNRIEIKEDDKPTEVYKFFSPKNRITIPSDIIDSLEGKEKELFNKNTSIDINIVLELSNHKRFQILENAKLYLFYPLKISSGFRFIIHSYFIVNPERTALRDSKLNNFLLKSIGHFICNEMLGDLKRNKNNTQNILCFNRIKDSKLDLLYDTLVSELINQRFIFDNKTKKYFKPTEVIITDDYDKGLFPSGKIGSKQLVFSDDEEVLNWLQNEFKIHYLTHDDVAKNIEKECRQQARLKNIKFFKDLYNYIINHQEVNLTGKKILLTSNWKLVSSNVDIFYGGKRKPINLPASIQKHIHFIHEEIKISDFREGKSRTGIKEYSTFELIRSLLNLLKKTSVSNKDILNALFDLYPYDLKSEVEIKKNILLPIIGNNKWLSPLSNPIYFDIEQIRELYPDGNFVDSEIVNNDKENNNDHISKLDFLMTLGVWNIPAIYNVSKVKVGMNESRDELCLDYSGLTSRPFIIQNDRKLDIPSEYNEWFTRSIFDNWKTYTNYINSGLFPRLQIGSSLSYYDRSITDYQTTQVSGVVETLKTEKWIVLKGEETPYLPNQVIGINLLDFNQAHNKVIGRFLKLLPMNFTNRKEFFNTIGILHLDGDSNENFINLLEFVYQEYEDNIPDGQDFVDFYNRIIGKIFDYYIQNESSGIIDLLKEKHFLCINDITIKREWQIASQIFHIDDQSYYNLLPSSIKNKVQPHFTKRDKNQFGRIASKIGKKLTSSISKRLIKTDIVQTDSLINYIKFLPESIALLELAINSVIDEHFERIRNISIHLHDVLKVAIKVINEPEETIIPVIHFIDTESNFDIHLKANVIDKNVHISDMLNELFINLLGRDLNMFSGSIRHFFNSPSKYQILKSYGVLEERIIDIKNALDISYLTTNQKFWDAVIDAKDISSKENIFFGNETNYQHLSDLLRVNIDIIYQIHTHFDFRETSNPNNIHLLSDLLNSISVTLEKLNGFIFPKIDFRSHFQKQIKNLKVKFEKGFESLLYSYLESQDPKFQTEYQNYIDRYRSELEYDIPLNTVDLDIETYFVEKLNSQFNFMKFNKGDLTDDYSTFDSIVMYKSGLNLFQSKLEFVNYTKKDLNEFLSINQNRSLLYFNKVSELEVLFRSWLNQRKKQPDADEDLLRFIIEYSKNGEDKYEGVFTSDSESSQKGLKNNKRGKGKRFDGNANDSNKKKVALAAELAAFEKLSKMYKNVTWVSKYASGVPEDYFGFNPEGQDGLGYDIEYIDDKGNKFFVEVKGKIDDFTSFEISKNELNKALEEGENFKVLFVTQALDLKKRKIKDLGNLFILEEGQDFFSNKKFTAIYKNFEIRFIEKDER